MELGSFRSNEKSKNQTNRAHVDVRGRKSQRKNEIHAAHHVTRLVDRRHFSGARLLRSHMCITRRAYNVPVGPDKSFYAIRLGIDPYHTLLLFGAHMYRPTATFGRKFWGRIAFLTRPSPPRVKSPIMETKSNNDFFHDLSARIVFETRSGGKKKENHNCLINRNFEKAKRHTTRFWRNLLPPVTVLPYRRCVSFVPPTRPSMWEREFPVREVTGSIFGWPMTFLYESGHGRASRQLVVIKFTNRLGDYINWGYQKNHFWHSNTWKMFLSISSIRGWKPKFF